MITNDQGRTLTVNGLTFTILEGSRKKASSDNLETFIEENYAELLRGLARQAGVQPAVVQDAFHDVLVRELERARRRAPRTGIHDLKSYLKMAALREYWSLLREEKRMIPFSKLGQDELAKILDAKPAAEPSPLETVVAHELGFLAKDRLEHLPLRQRHVLACWSAGLTIPEIARAANTTAGNVRFHKHAAIQSLRDKFGVEDEETA
jgi:RNA polymerase sigma factor (sigma-70 family)